VRVVLDSAIRFDALAISPVVRQQIESALRTANPAKPAAVREKLWSARFMDDMIELFSFDGDGVMVLPMGFLSQFEQGMRASGVSLEVEDRRRWYDRDFLAGCTPISLRDYQEPMCEALIRGERGLGEAPTGAGKTSVALEAIRRVGQPALIIVEKASLAQQWRARIQDQLGVEAGYLGEGKMILRPITVAIRASLWSKRDELYRTFVPLDRAVKRCVFDAFGTIVLDEAHRLKGQTATEIFQRFTARHRWGVSATPERDPLYFPIIRAVIGPILWETTTQDAAEHLVKPSVRVLESSFDFDYRPTQRLIDTTTGKGFTARNNYSAMMDALCSDQARNSMIAGEAEREKLNGHHVLIVSRRTDHLDAIRQLLDDYGVFTLTGKSKGSDVIEIADQIASADGGTILLSSVADEGLDIPRLDRVVLAYPGRNPEVFKQQIGRVMRPWPGKDRAVIIDIRDQQSLLRSQYSTRAHQLYGREGLHIDRISGTLR
jgi:superfamily II DNA or RNA helicase